MLPDAEHPLFLLFATLGASEIAAGNPTNSATLLEFARILEGHGFYTQEDVTAPTVFRPTIEDMMDEVTGLDPGLRALFCRALKPGDSLAGFVDLNDSERCTIELCIFFFRAWAIVVEVSAHCPILSFVIWPSITLEVEKLHFSSFREKICRVKSERSAKEGRLWSC